MKNLRFPAFVLVLIVAMAASGLVRLKIDTDIVRSLPSGERVLADALDIFEHHPIHDQVAIDIMVEKDAPDTLVEVGAFVEEELEKSGLFSQVGTESIGELIPELAQYIAENLPLLFTKHELETEVAPLLSEPHVNNRLLEMYGELSSMDGIGQAGFMGLDPLNLRNLILAKMAPLAPSLDARFYRGRLLSADGHHLLVTAKPKATGTDTVSAQGISDLMEHLSREVNEKFAASGQSIVLTPVGAYRAALDNERIIRHDVKYALIFVTLGIGLLLLFSFPRPLLGLLSLLPALAGTAAALFVYSLFHSSLSIMVLGFGGAVVSITVDHGIGYLLFLDRRRDTKGLEASHEIRAIGIMAVITSIGAFVVLSCSGFPIFMQLGQFTALGIFFSFLFVHTVFPRIFVTMPAGKPRGLPVRNLVNGLYGLGKPGAIAAALFALVLLFYAKPAFHVDLSSMNTVSEETLKADALFTKVWGSIGQRVFLMNDADSISELQRQNDSILTKIEEDIEQNVVQSTFIPSLIFPGMERGGSNLLAWKNFWTEQRRGSLEIIMGEKGDELGFIPEAFAAFLSQLAPATLLESHAIPPKFFRLLGIAENDKEVGLIQFITVIPGGKYNGANFSARYGDDAKVFDANFFTDRLADVLFSTFASILGIIAMSVILLVFFFYLDWRLTLLTLLPPVFAYICTLGTLGVMGRPLDIPSLMLSVVILGMGIDYSIFCVRAHQRYRYVEHPSYSLVRVTVFIAGGSTLIGFGVLAIADHSLLKSIGITSLLGIGYSLIGTFLLLPPLLKHHFSKEKRGDMEQNGNLLTRVNRRFRTLEAYPRMFAFCKLRVDPMFSDIEKILEEQKDVSCVVDIGCGYGVPACWLLEKYSTATVHGIDPDPERIRVASIAAGSRGTFSCGLAPDIPALPNVANIVLLLDMFHYLDDETAMATLKNSHDALGEGGVLVVRYVIQPSGSPSWSWHLEDKRIRMSGNIARYRSQETMAKLMEAADFIILKNEITASNPELCWMVGRTLRVTGDVG